VAPPRRNDPCPCGSGRKFKKCCSGRERAREERSARAYWGLFLLVFLGGGGLALVGALSSSPPEPGEYDPATNRYWDPDHGHWHDGLPPGGGGAPGAASRPAAPPASTPLAEEPAPWEYDPVAGRHWNPEHGHWHDGRPPAGEEEASRPEPTSC